MFEHVNRKFWWNINITQWEPGDEVCDLQRVNAEYRHGGVDTEALQAGQHGVGPDEEGDHVSEGGDGDSNTRVLHRLAKPGK